MGGRVVWRCARRGRGGAVAVVERGKKEVYGKTKLGEQRKREIE